MAQDEAHLEHLPHVLYRMFDDERRLLYVGISMNLGKRTDRHREDKPWFRSVAYISVQHFPNRTAAMTAERRAIVTEQPLHNLAHSGNPGDPFRDAPRTALRMGDLPPRREVLPSSELDRVIATHGPSVPSLMVNLASWPGCCQVDLGAKVVHATFGLGTIVYLREVVNAPTGPDAILYVEFANGDMKPLLSRYAPLELVA